MIRPASKSTVPGANGDKPRAMRSALMNSGHSASPRRNCSANVVLPAPLGPDDDAFGVLSLPCHDQTLTILRISHKNPPSPSSKRIPWPCHANEEHLSGPSVPAEHLGPVENV